LIINWYEATDLAGLVGSSYSSISAILPDLRTYPSLTRPTEQSSSTRDRQVRGAEIKPLTIVYPRLLGQIALREHRE
jgi:hypothetical protein